MHLHYRLGVCSQQETTSVQFSVQFCKKKLRLSVRFHVHAFFHLCLYSMMLEMTYCHVELVELIVSPSEAELEVQK